ncbi:hypothetical protein VPH35_002210 [Triticum aestivum]|uniref:uncharacterized protein isoform X1 n=1 Tax=Triticum aestivum TaxID=4565 RepID=UPI001D00EC70|nr:uncharacterized protein LOC123047608 isoform X1 [Triticum aestivum]
MKQLVVSAGQFSSHHFRLIFFHRLTFVLRRLFWFRPPPPLRWFFRRDRTNPSLALPHLPSPVAAAAAPQPNPAAGDLLAPLRRRPQPSIPLPREGKAREGKGRERECPDPRRHQRAVVDLIRVRPRGRSAMEVRRGPAAAMDGRRRPKPYPGRRLNLQGRASATADLRMTAPDLDAQPAAAAAVGRPNARALPPSLMALLPPTLPPSRGCAADV